MRLQGTVSLCTIYPGLLWSCSGEVSFETAPFEEQTEITGHPVARLSVALDARDGSNPSELDLFLTLRHLTSNGEEGKHFLTPQAPLRLNRLSSRYLLTLAVFYTGASGDPVPVVKGWLRLSLRATDSSQGALSKIIPIRNYYSTDVQPVQLGTVYTTDVEIWPTNVVLSKGDKLVLQVAGMDTQGCGVFEHNHPEDRAEAKLKGWNSIHLGTKFENYLRLPIIPKDRG